MPRVAFVGAGSAAFTRNLIGDVLAQPELAGSTFALMDIDPARLETSRAARARRRGPVPGAARGLPPDGTGVRYEVLRHVGVPLDVQALAVRGGADRVARGRPASRHARPAHGSRAAARRDLGADGRADRRARRADPGDATMSA